MRWPGWARPFGAWPLVSEWTGSATGAIGAMLLALNVPVSGYAWLLLMLSNAAWIFYAVQKRICSILLMQVVFTTTSLVGIHRWLIAAPAPPAQGVFMQSDAPGPDARNAQQTLGEKTAPPSNVHSLPQRDLSQFNPTMERPNLPQEVDVSQVAAAAALYGTVLMDAEAFGVTVTRRPGATGPQLAARPRTGDRMALSPHERGRLLDVLCHAQAVQGKCSITQETSFPVWIVSSDARDAQPRAVWLVMTRRPSGAFHIKLSDL